MEFVANLALDAILNQNEDWMTNLNESSDTEFIMTQLAMIENLLGDTISGSSVPDESNPKKRVDRGLFREDLCEILNILEEDERRVISARYGLADGLTRTGTAVAAQMKQSKAWVQSQECRALWKLRQPWYEQRLKQHQNALIN
jgi:DNA-directed RNA polymerase sigma subunit (sigma70/sigma32)